jgi:hypothetical protein
MNRSSVHALVSTVLACSLVVALPAAAHQTSNVSQGSELSLLPVAVSVAAPVALLSAGAVFTVVAVQASALGTVWVLERGSDGVQASIHFTGDVVGASATLVGTAVVATVFSAGCVLSAAGRAIAFIPNEVGKSLLYNERVTR